ncbi:MAG: hypothetical protein ACR2MO_03685 [Acidimicrobiales bacterium]
MGMAWVVGLPFLVLAAWLALKSNRLQPPMVPELDEHGEIVKRPVRPAPERTPRPSRRRRRASDDADDPSVDGSPGRPRTPPPPSKRYTPPQRPR